MDRIVYILTPTERMLTCVVRTTKLMKWESFSAVDFPNLRALFRPQYASYVGPEDHAILMGLIQLVKREGEAPVLDGEYGGEVFQKMLQTRRLFCASGDHIRLQAGPAIPAHLGWESLPGDLWRPSVHLSTATSALAFALNPPIYLDGPVHTCGPLELSEPRRLVTTWLAAKPMGETEVASFCLRLAKNYPETTFPTPDCVKLNEVAAAQPRALLTVQTRSITDRREQRAAWVDLRDHLRLRLRFRYGEGVVAWDAAETTVSHRRDGEIVRVARDSAWERQVIAELDAWGFQTEDTGGGDAGFFNFDSSVFALRAGFTWRDWLGQTLPGLDGAKWEVEFTKGLRVTLAGESDVYSDAIDQGNGGFSVDLGVEIGGRKISLLPILHQALRRVAKRNPAAMLDGLRTGDFAVRVDAGAEESPRHDLVSLPGALLVRVTDHLHEMFDRKPFGADGRTRVNQWRVGELVVAGLLVEKSGDGLAEIVKLCERLGAGIAVAARPAPLALRARLRPYQELGLGWLHTLDEVAAGGILADDMGLGKTVQTIAHLLELRAAGRLTKGVLIVAPTSVIDNWEDELARFAPGLTVGRFHGADRDARWEQTLHRNVVVTTYALLWRDIERLRTRQWDLAILDEAQYIKNAASRTSLAARGLNADRKLCLTGTPIENRLEDIWALFEFLLPGFLGDESTFKNLIAKPLTDDDESMFADVLRARLRKRLAPFVLRRSKADVLPDLPEKTEVVLAVSMTPAQADLYESVRQEAADGIQHALREKGLAASRIQILTRLLKLRQICCDPRLLDGERTNDGAIDDSAKLVALLDLIDRLHAQGDRTLIFSQFTSMLDLIAAALDAADRKYLMLTGKTRDRAEVVRRFQAGECPLFLISLKAGGAGLNLTAANSVIHYDPWWNPAVERQATDRSHRIGQGKPVFVYKLITDDSIESKIQQLHRTKLALVEGLLSEGDVERLELDETTIDYLLAP